MTLYLENFVTLRISEHQESIKGQTQMVARNSQSRPWEPPLKAISVLPRYKRVFFIHDFVALVNAEGQQGSQEE